MATEESEFDAGKYQRAEERLCTCGAAGSGEGHEDWCDWVGSEWELKGLDYINCYEVAARAALKQD